MLYLSLAQMDLPITLLGLKFLISLQMIRRLNNATILYKGLDPIWDHLGSSLALDNVAFPLSMTSSGLSSPISDAKSISSENSHQVTAVNCKNYSCNHLQSFKITRFLSINLIFKRAIATPYFTWGRGPICSPTVTF